MTEDQLRALLNDVQSGATDVDTALERVRHLPFEDMGFAKVDHHRALRHGMPEVVFGMGKTTDHVVAIAGKLLERSSNVLITRANPAMAERVTSELPGGEYFPMSGAIRFWKDRAPPRQRQNRGSLRGHQRHSRGRRSPGHSRGDGERGRVHPRYRRGRNPSAPEQPCEARGRASCGGLCGDGRRAAERGGRHGVCAR